MAQAAGITGIRHPGDATSPEPPSPAILQLTHVPYPDEYITGLLKTIDFHKNETLTFHRIIRELRGELLNMAHTAASNTKDLVAAFA